MNVEMKLKEYTPSDLDDIIEIFEKSIIGTCRKDYADSQIQAWLSGIDREKWNGTFLEHYSLLAYFDGKPIGFGDISKEGHLNLLYVLPGFQHRGVATRICEELERNAKYPILVEASITAKPFFLNRGYTVMKEQKVYRKGVALTNFRMKKEKASG